MAAWGWGEGKWGVTANAHRASFSVDENVLYWGAVRVTQLCEYTETHYNIHFKRVNFVVCELYLNRAVMSKKKPIG